MNCRDIEPLLLAEQDSVLTIEQHSSLDQHVAVCPACQQLRARLAKAMAAYAVDAATVAVPEVGVEWEKLRRKLHEQSAEPAKKRRLAPVIWLGTSLAAAAAVAFAFFTPNALVVSASDPALSAPEIAQADYVEAGNADASTMVYVDKESGWLVVWAADNDTETKS